MSKTDRIQSNGAEVAQGYDALNFTNGLDVSEAQGVVSVGLSEDGLTLTNTTTDNTISVDQNGNVGTAVATDGAIHIENTGNTGIGLGVYSNIGATADAPLVSIMADNTAFDQSVLTISNDGAGNALTIVDGGNNCFQVKADGTTELGINSWIKLNGGQGVFYQNTTLGVAKLHEIIHSGATGVAIDIDRDGNSASYVFGMTITVDNAGAGNLVGGIDFSGMSDTEPLFKLTSTDTDLSTKSPETDAEAGWFPVVVGTTKYAVPIYALS